MAIWLPLEAPRQFPQPLDQRTFGRPLLFGIGPYAENDVPAGRPVQFPSDDAVAEIEDIAEF